MNKLKFIYILTAFFAISNSYCQEKHGLTKKTIPTSELKTWQMLGKGEVSTWGDQVSLKETEGSKGIMLISPDSYSENVIVKYKVLALTPATVIVTMLSVSDNGNSNNLVIPENYNGNIGLWTKEKENYFFAFKNASHNVTPFVKKNPNAKESLASAKENIMIAGKYYDIEVGKQKSTLWLSIDGEKVFETTDKSALKGGHIALRLRGTAGFVAGCLIKDLEIYSK